MCKACSQIALFIICLSCCSDFEGVLLSLLFCVWWKDSPGSRTCVAARSSASWAMLHFTAAFRNEDRLVFQRAEPSAAPPALESVCWVAAAFGRWVGEEPQGKVSQPCEWLSEGNEAVSHVPGIDGVHWGTKRVPVTNDASSLYLCFTLVALHKAVRFQLGQSQVCPCLCSLCSLYPCFHQRWGWLCRCCHPSRCRTARAGFVCRGGFLLWPTKQPFLYALWIGAAI